MNGSVTRLRIAAICLLIGAASAVFGSLLPWLNVVYNDPSAGVSVTTVTTGWDQIQYSGSQGPSNLGPMLHGYVLVLAALLALAAAITEFRTAKGDLPSVRAFGGLAAGFLAATTLVSAVPSFGRPTTPDPHTVFSVGVGVPVLLCGCAVAVAAGVLVVIGWRTIPTVPWSAPGAPWPAAQPSWSPQQPHEPQPPNGNG